MNMHVMHIEREGERERERHCIHIGHVCMMYIFGICVRCMEH